MNKVNEFLKRGRKQHAAEMKNIMINITAVMIGKKCQAKEAADHEIARYGVAQK